jgi:hypothetical protein
MICPECGHKWETKERAASEGEMKDVTAEYNILRGKYIGDLTPIELFTYAKIVNKKAFAKRVATSKGEDYLQEYATACGWKNGWQHHIVADAGIEFYNIKIK